VLTITHPPEPEELPELDTLVAKGEDFLENSESTIRIWLPSAKPSDDNTPRLKLPSAKETSSNASQNSP